MESLREPKNNLSRVANFRLPVQGLEVLYLQIRATRAEYVQNHENFNKAESIAAKTLKKNNWPVSKSASPFLIWFSIIYAR